MQKGLRKAPLLLAAIVGLCPFTVAIAEPPDHAPAHGYRAKQRYVYYPEREIYYRQDDGVWFWLAGGNWEFGARLPSSYQQFAVGGVSIDLDTDRPYTEHRYVVEHYGKGKGKGKKNKGGNGGGPGNSGHGNGNGKGNKHKD